MAAADKKPIKRAKEIRFLSRDHHHELLLCWKIRTGFSKNISKDRIKKYVDWFYRNHLENHFQVEEEYLFPILGVNNKMVKKALTQHRRLNRLFKQSKNLKIVLNQIEEELEQHIRFEERILFNAIQEMASPEQLTRLERFHGQDKFVENTEDEFWI